MDLIVAQPEFRPKKTPLLSVAGFLASGWVWCLCALEIPATGDGNEKDEDDEKRDDGPRQIGSNG
ncbi:MAG: hypothetical protein ACNA7E_02335, partial [Wenzhouxiangellaceae bacterium]